jgi:hypothetical protein
MPRTTPAALGHAKAILNAYMKFVYPDKIIDQNLWEQTGLSWGQYRNGKRYLRDHYQELVTDPGNIYHADHLGWCITTRRESGSDMMDQRVATAKVQLQLVYETSVAPLVSSDEVRQRRLVRAMRNVFEELDDLKSDAVKLLIAAV